MYILRYGVQGGNLNRTDEIKLSNEKIDSKGRIDLNLAITKDGERQTRVKIGLENEDLEFFHDLYINKLKSISHETQLKNIDLETKLANTTNFINQLFNFIQDRFLRELMITNTINAMN